jgi:Tfp pilus assembly protein PilF
MEDEPVGVLARPVISASRALVEKAWSTPGVGPEDFAPAEALLRGELARDPKDVLTLTCLGTVLCDEMKYAEAGVFLRQAIELGSRDRNTFESLGVQQMYLGSRKQAQATFRRARRLKPDPRSWAAYFDPHGY